MLKGTAREAAAEFLGTFILIMFGVGVVAQTVLSRGVNGSFLAINIGWGLAVMIGVYAAGGVSGAHLNPAVTIALAATRGFSWAKVAPYVIAQVAGAFVASAVVFLTYRGAVDAFHGRWWATRPRPLCSPPTRSRFSPSSAVLSINWWAPRC
jgi:MIP family channel proteins